MIYMTIDDLINAGFIVTGALLSNILSLIGIEVWDQYSVSPYSQWVWGGNKLVEPIVAQN